MKPPVGLTLTDVNFSIGDFSMKDFCLSIESGEYFVLTGKNGAGKSVLIKIIAGLTIPDTGRISLAGRDITKTPPWKRNIGYVPQDSALFPNRTVEGNIAFGLEVRGTGRKKTVYRVHEIAELFGITHLLNRKPQGLSGGETQKAAIARALILNPKLLLMDEPVSALDSDARKHFCTEFKRIHNEIRVTTLHISHNQEETRMVADRIGVMNNGSISDMISSFTTPVFSEDSPCTVK